MPIMRAAGSTTIQLHGITARPLVVPSRGSTELAIWAPGEPAWAQ